MKTFAFTIATSLLVGISTAVTLVDPEPPVEVTLIDESNIAPTQYQGNAVDNTNGGPTTYAADLSGCGINRDCVSCSRQYGCMWNAVSGCTAGFGAFVCPIVPTPDAAKPTCSAYTDCRSCTTQAGCVFYRGQCTYSRGTGCMNDPQNCVNYPIQCPAVNPNPPSQCFIPPCFQVGSYCDTYQKCGQNQTCEYNRCVPTKKVGSYCDTYQKCGQNQTCEYNRCVPTKPSNYCTTHNDCARDHLCDFTINKCTAVFYNPVVEACYYDHHCSSGQYCNTSQGRCESYPPVDSFCNADYHCPSYQYCDFYDSKCKFYV